MLNLRLSSCPRAASKCLDLKQKTPKGFNLTSLNYGFVVPFRMTIRHVLGEIRIYALLRRCDGLTVTGLGVIGCRAYSVSNGFLVVMSPFGNS